MSGPPGSRAPRSPGHATRDRWLLSYGDFLTLLLALFVVLYASARVDAERNRGLFEGIQSAFVPGASPEPAAIPDLAGSSERSIDRDQRLAAMTLGRAAALERLESGLAKQLERLRARLRSDPGISLHPTERGLVLTLAAAEYFPEGGAEIRADRKAILAALAPLLSAESGALHFEGHTDDRPIGPGSAFPSNWELSSARAAAVARYFIEEQDLDATRVATTGYADQRPLVDDDAPAARARNRRVEIVVLADADPGQLARKVDPERELTRLLEKLPPLEQGEAAALRPPPPGPIPVDAPLP